MMDAEIRQPVRLGIFVCLVTFGVFGLWSAVAPIEGAAQAPGVVVVKSHKKVVQHLEGGIVEEILVKNGDSIALGQPLLILDDTQSVAQLGIAKTQYRALKAREARLVSERDGLAAVPFPDDLVNEETANETSIFNSRRAANVGRLDVLNQRIEQLNAQLTGLRAMQASKVELALSYEEELKDARELLNQGFADKTRVRELERNYSQMSGEAADLLATLSSTEIEIGETRLQVIQLENEFQTEVVSHLGETRTQLRDLQERITALGDVVARTVIKSPESGVVINLQVHTVGAVIDAGLPILDVVPNSDELVVEARVSPLDIDRVSVGQEAIVRFSSFSLGVVPTLHGEVLSVSADSLADPITGTAYYLARVEVNEGSAAALSNLVLMPGMPAEVFISTGARTFLQYLFKPLSNAAARSFRED